MIVFVHEYLENIVGKGENAGHQHFLHFSHCFQKASFSSWLKVRIVGLKCSTLYHKIPSFNDPEKEAL